MTRSGTAIVVGSVFEPIGELRALSNFHLSVLSIGGTKYSSVEHYYQASKTRNKRLRAEIRNAGDPADAKRLAWRLPSQAFRKDWDCVRREVMKRALSAKARQCKEFRDVLRWTWPVPLLEDSMLDSFWGIGADGKGANELGKLLMEIRAKLLVDASSSNVVQFSERPNWTPDSRLRIAFVRVRSQTAQPAGKTLRQLARTPLTRESIWRNVADTLSRGGYPLGRELDNVTQEGRAAFLRWAQKRASVTRAQANRDWMEARRKAFDRKYSDYSWADDARSKVHHWAKRFIGHLSHVAGPAHLWAPGLVVGAGSAHEAQKIWKRFGNNMVLSDIGPSLTRNCRLQAPSASVLESDTESLASIKSESIGLYCALRTFESSFLDVRKSLAEAVRVLRPGGCIFLSASDGYVGSDGSLRAGRIIHDRIELGAAFADIGEWATILKDHQFTKFQIHSLGSEILLTSHKLG